MVSAEEEINGGIANAVDAVEGEGKSDGNKGDERGRSKNICVDWENVDQESINAQRAARQNIDEGNKPHGQVLQNSSRTNTLPLAKPRIHLYVSIKEAWCSVEDTCSFNLHVTA